jgi:hypothetical protein
LSTPPRLSPRESSSLTKRIGTATVTVACSAMRRKSTCSGRSLTGWNWTSLGSVRVWLPAQSIITTEFMKWPVESIFTSAFSSRWIAKGSCFSP